MIYNSKAVTAQNIVLWQNRVPYKLKLNNNRCVNFSLSCITAAKMSICLQLWDEFTKEIQRVHAKAEDWVCLGFFCCGVFFVLFCFLDYILSLVNCLIHFSTERAWEIVTRVS